ncbi:PEGA domain-containing protein [Marinobacter sp. ATCH36]|uniref:MORN repeat-containing protein n=1 Tax=Marinobacter sp. ATCH36 TaxID=2945106 RepID=UPI00202088BC|nr:PEGA domain-containing protein [Marinobacter sp. ATCH36]MCL7944945.1 PEGA domain-containing protein [Marinobacter sp. ATCH36]
MVDFRPLLFVNALALMLLVTAGFASVRSELSMNTDTVASEPETGELYQDNSKEPAAEPFFIPELPDDPKLVAVSEQPSAMPESGTDASPMQPEEPRPTTGKLVLRSNVVGDEVTINGKEYGATRLDLELEAGQYEVVISKEGYKPWQQTVALSAGNEKTLVGKLDAYTRVEYRDGTWIGGVKTGDGTYEDANGLRYEGHFVAGEFDGQGTLRLANNDILTGQWSEGQLNGHGSLTTSDGTLYVGGFRNDEFHGEGTLTYPDGRRYEGEFSNGEFHGQGQEVFADGKKYEGGYIEGSFHGKGLLRNPNGSSIEATFRYGEPYGQVRLTTAAGEVFTARTKEPGVCYRDKSYRATQCPKLEGW